jgi:hypothetical protein
MNFASDITDKLQTPCSCCGPRQCISAQTRLRLKKKCINPTAILQNPLAVANGGDGYATGNYLTLDGGSYQGAPALLYVSEVDGDGKILAVIVANSAVYSSPPPALATSTTVSGTGTGATFYPIISLCCSSYTSLKFFNYTGGEQQFTVPEGVTSIIAHLYGGGGGGGIGDVGAKGGGGAYIVGELDVTPDSVVTLSVGGGASTALPGNNAGGYGGGGNGLFKPFTVFTRGGGGGGCSKLIYNTTDLLIAGGGGGGGASNSLSTNIAGIGGGGGSTGGNGEGTNFGSGGSTMGGAGGINGNSGIKGEGGDGKEITISSFIGFSMAAGGGGYYGGGAAGYSITTDSFGRQSVIQGGGGGGGSSYYDPTIVRSVYNPAATTDGTSAGFNSPYYQSGIGIGGIPRSNTANNGGNGMIVLIY